MTTLDFLVISDRLISHAQCAHHESERSSELFIRPAECIDRTTVPILSLSPPNLSQDYVILVDPEVVNSRRKLRDRPLSQHDRLARIRSAALFLELLRGPGLSILERGFLGFDLKEGATLAEAKQLAEHLNDAIPTISYTE